MLIFIVYLCVWLPVLDSNGYVLANYVSRHPYARSSLCVVKGLGRTGVPGVNGKIKVSYKSITYLLIYLLDRLGSLTLRY